MLATLGARVRDGLKYGATDVLVDNRSMKVGDLGTFGQVIHHKCIQSVCVGDR